MSEKEIIVITTPSLPGYEILKILGPVHGLTVRTRGGWRKIRRKHRRGLRWRSDFLYF